MIYITTYPLTQRINPMRKLLLTTAAVAAAIGLAVAGETAFGTFTDTRDGQTYKTVKIGEQTWMAENLNYITDRYWRFGDTTDFNISWCYNNDISYCYKYGRLYDWETATTVCPKGWMLPSRVDWNKLVTTTGGWETAGKKLKSKSGWNENGNGTDNYGFSALPGGSRLSNGDFFHAGYLGLWWTATENSDGNAYYGVMSYYSGRVGDEGYHKKSSGDSVRCVQD